MQKTGCIMKRIIALMTALTVPLLCAASACATTEPVLDRGFDVDLATVLIIVICSVAAAALLTIAVILANRNMHN